MEAIESNFLSQLFCIIFFFFFVFFSGFGFGINGEAPDAVVAGRWNEIPDVLNNSHVQDLGMFAVRTYNNSTGCRLFFYAVFQAQAQIVVGLNVRMVIQAVDNELPKMYKAYVWETPWEGFKNLTSFESVLG